MIVRRVLTLIRQYFPETHILVRGDGHFSGPEFMGLIDSMPNIDFIFGFSFNVTLLELAEPTRLRACDLWIEGQMQDVGPSAVRLLYTLVHFKSECVDLDERTSMLIGAISKVGIFPALVSYFILIQKLEIANNFWWAFVYAVPILYFLAFFSQSTWGKLNRHIALYELAIEILDDQLQEEGDDAIGIYA